MNAHFTTTKPAPDAKVQASMPDLRVKSLDSIQPGELVYCQATADIECPALEGVCQVVEIRDGRIASRSHLHDHDGDLIWERVAVITHHLPGYEYWKGRVSPGNKDAKLIQLGDWMADLMPLERELWAKCVAMREALDAIGPDAWQTDAEYRRAIDDHATRAGCPLSLMAFAAERSYASTPAGHAARMMAFEYDLNQGSEWSDDKLLELAAEARAIADWEQPRLTVGKTLDDLIEAHRQTAVAFAAAVDKQAEASSAWDRKKAKNIYTTPVRIRDGRVVASHEVDGAGDGEDDRAIIDREHDRWAAELSVNRVEQMSASAAQLIRGQIEASRIECHRTYDEVTFPALKIARADFDAVNAEFDAAYQAEIAALGALNRYRPTDLVEVGALARYLLSTDFYSGCETAEFANQLMVTLSTLGLDD